MLGDLVTNVLVLLLGYGFPALESFKTLESRPIELRQLNFWLQYWTIVGIVTVFEWFSDIFISWLPMYGEAKLAFFIYLWHSKTMGTTMVYEAFLRPIVVKHEPEIEKRLRRFRAKSGDLLLLYIKNFTEKGQSFFLEMLQYVIARSNGSKKEENKRSGSHPIAIKKSKHPETAEENVAEPKMLEVAREFLKLTTEEEEEEEDQRSGSWWQSRKKNKK